MNFPFLPVYDGDENPPEEKDVEKKEAEKPAKVKLTPEQQAFVNSLLAEERRKAATKNEQLITQLETEKNRAGTSAAEKQSLEDRIAQLRDEYATKDELKSRESEKKLKELSDKAKQLETEAMTWRERYDRDRKRTDLIQAASVEKAYNPRQVVNELFDKTRLVEVVDADGKGTGEFETRVRLTTKDKEGKPVVLDLQPVEAVKQLKESAEYANLFVSTVTGGLGGGNLGRGAGAEKKPHEMSTDEYMAFRRKGGKV